VIREGEKEKKWKEVKGNTGEGESLLPNESHISTLLTITPYTVCRIDFNSLEKAKVAV